MATTAICTGLFALVTAAVAIYEARISEKLSPKVEQLNSTLLLQEQRQRQIESSLKEINLFIQKLRNDSLP